MIFYAMDKSLKQRKSISTADVHNPFAYRKANPCAAPENDLDSSQTSLSHENSGKSVAMVYAVKVLSLLLVGFAAGLLYHLIVTSKTAQRRLSNAPEVPYDEFLTDELVTKLAQQNQFQQEEIEDLKKQVLAQEEERQRLLEEEERKREERLEEERQARRQQQVLQEQQKATPHHIVPRRVIDMSRPEVAQGRIIGQIDEETGLFVRTSNLRGGNSSR